jgi:UDP-N-acetylglucosamine/UDP-N-acetylgalactosamine diphosphorylase
VTLGSLINFCDCLMAGGTGREDHSEVGSSYVHFNYTPQQDKATPSLIGDVSRGVMLDQPPIFLGGQGGLVGPARIDYGTVITAGTVWRQDSLGAKLLHGGESRPRRQDFHAGVYHDIRRKVYNNILYLANLLALRQWYLHVRRPFFLRQELGEEIFGGVSDLLEAAIGERLRRFRDFSEKMDKSIFGGEATGGNSRDLLRQQRELKEKWPEVEACFEDAGQESIGGKNRDVFLEIIQKRLAGNSGYIEAIREVGAEVRLAGTLWLQAIVDDVTQRALARLPSFRSHVT